MTQSEPFLRPDEQELLQEIMNIAFGQAAADLAEMVDIFVVLSIPEVRLITASELPAFLTSAMGAQERFSLVEQEFWGPYKGSGYLMLPSTATRELACLLGNTEFEGNSNLPLKDLEMETLQEVGNILIGACVGKVAELLDTSVTYCPPTVAQEFVPGEALPTNIWEPGTTAIVLKTLFRFSGRNVNGLLFLVTSQDSLEWLRKALAAFLGRYA
jgi:chemotaxis protein CheC